MNSTYVFVGVLEWHVPSTHCGVNPLWSLFLLSSGGLPTVAFGGHL